MLDTCSSHPHKLLYPLWNPGQRWLLNALQSVALEWGQATPGLLLLRLGEYAGCRIFCSTVHVSLSVLYERFQLDQEHCERQCEFAL